MSLSYSQHINQFIFCLMNIYLLNRVAFTVFKTVFAKYFKKSSLLYHPNGDTYNMNTYHDGNDICFTTTGIFYCFKKKHSARFYLQNVHRVILHVIFWYHLGGRKLQSSEEELKELRLPEGSLTGAGIQVE